ncbi:MAG: AAA family ATPase [Bacteroidales bacterium]|nr:AAA family ATPase [Bacteroidales bacterium]
MLKNHFTGLLSDHLGYPPTQGQQRLIEVLAGFVTENQRNRVLIIKGYAGTGKTTIVSSLVNVLESLGRKTLLLAPTGRAAKILSAYSGKHAYTIHKRIYRQKSAADTFGIFVLEKNLFTNTLFLVDEASMISNHTGENNIFGTGRLLDDLLQYVLNEKNCNLIIIGDTAQLPPVGTSISPALDQSVLRHYFNETLEIELTDVVRQSQQSGILVNATLIRNNIMQKKIEIPKIHIRDFTDIQIIRSDELSELLSQSYDTDGLENTIVICRSNKRANKFNEAIRKQILSREEEVTANDLLMVVRNNYYWLSGSDKIDFIANGDIVRVVKIRKIQEIYGYRFADAIIELIDYNIRIEVKIMLDSLTVDGAAMSQDDNQKLFNNITEDYQDLQPRKKQYEKVKANAFFNALQVKYAYAVTCHKAQGGQWKNVYLDFGYFRTENIDIDFLRWLYTAFTRATDKLYLVNFPAELVNQ